MKKIKEFIKKIGNKKYCLLSLLLAGLLLFAVVSGLNGPKSAKTEVNAISAPTTKNLDLNGVRYTYQTSLKELKNTYGFFKKWYYMDLFRITNNTEGESQIYLNHQTSNETLSPEQINLTSSLLEQSLSFYQRELNSNIINKLDNSISFDNINSSQTTNDLVFSFDNIDNFQRLKNFSVNFSLLKQIPYFNSSVDDLTFNSFTMNFVFVKNDLNNNEIDNIEYMDNNVKFFSYCFSNQVDYYNFELPIISEYTIRNIYLTFEETDENNPDTIIQSVPNEYISLDKERMSKYGIVIKNIKFIENNESNIISYNFDFERNEKYVEEVAYSGNILLSETNYDRELYTYLENTIPRKQLELPFKSTVRFGGNFEFAQPRRSIFFSPVEDRINGFYIAAFGYENDNNWKNSYFYKSLNRDIIYLNQNRLLYLSGIEDLRMNNANYSGAALSAQVQDILYNVEYVGDIEEKDFNQKTQDDLVDLLKTTGLGAVIGILIGFLVGNPIGGLVVGAVIGFAVAIIPLIIDGLQAIFGYNFLSGLYNFFNAITEFFVNLVDTIINFLLSIITNPFILILIVIVAILYIFVIRPKIK